MKAKINKDGVLLTYQLGRNEYPSFEEQVRKQKDSGKAFEYHDGMDKEDSWIQAERWLE